MPTIEFEGDWSPEEIQIHLQRLQKSLSVGEGVPENLIPPPISKLNPAPQPTPHSFIPPSFPLVDGAFGKGVYFPVALSDTAPQLRLRVDITPEQLINESDFESLDFNLTTDLDTVLDANGVQGVLQHAGDRPTALMIRNPDNLLVLGVLASHPGPYQVISMQPEPDHLILDLASVGNSLTKSVSVSRRATLCSQSHLNGSRLVRSSAPPLDRGLVRRAIERCRADGVNLEEIQVCLSPGKPDFLTGMVHAFCLPSDGVVHLCPHDPLSAIASLARQLSDRLRVAVRSGALSPDTALELLALCAQMTPEWWLEMLIKRYAGAILVDRKFGLMNGGNPPSVYMNLLAGRGVAIWGNRRTIAECMAEDYRVAFTPAGLPNFQCLEIDAAVPGIARSCQQRLVELLL
ncbi:hypothetical protein H6F43_03805 [Leptolyngbya sp. FACHB-36]|uniref:hypothetical protein n=1 Tax=Leptolyngbya sp. FACHB-36 TaxID=2692808 RepID=UPI0016801420|nr:hypothetical protein [Leptolyngbya sp. FACHB-36]MBD2019307.1 hypothetical protein [Leptolyngbya sp. FACHB-36]